MAKKEYSYKFDKCKTTAEAMKKLERTAEGVTVKKLADGQESMISMEAYDKKRAVRFFAFLHKKDDEDGIFLTGEFELIPTVKIAIAAAFVVVTLAAFVLAGVQYALATGVAGLYEGEMNPCMIPVVAAIAAIMCTIVVLWLISFILWNINEPSFDEIAELVERAVKKNEE